MSTMRVTNLKHENSASNNIVLNSDGSVGGDLATTLAEKLPYSYGTATPTTTDSGFLWYDSNSTPPQPKYWDGSTFRGLAGANWVSYTPSVTNLTKGNGTEVARYARIGNTVALTYIFIFGSTSSVSGGVAIDLPVNAFTSGSGAGILTETGVLNYDAGVSIGSTNFSVNLIVANSTYASVQGISATTPFTWGAGDQIKANLIYEAV